MTIAKLPLPPWSQNVLRDLSSLTLNLPSLLNVDEHQFAYWVNRLTEDAVITELHTALTDLNQPNI